MTRVVKRVGGKARVLGMVSVFALSAALNAASADEPTKKIDIDAQPLQNALLEFSEQTDIVVVAPASLVKGKAAPEVTGDLGPYEALGRLLQGTGLRYSLGEEGEVTIISLEKVGAVENGSGTQLAMLQQSETSRVSDGNQTGADGPLGPSEVDGRGSVTGEITDGKNGGNLKGALVEIMETGQRARTDTLGRFRFPAVRSGTYTLRVSYLGYGEARGRITVSDGELLERNFALAATIEQVVVFGTRSARAQSLNRERTAENSQTVLSADALGSFNGTTISEALRRAPGVAFIPDPNTGDGTNIIIRGLEPDLNQIELNGITLLDGTGIGRSPNLAGILTESIESVTISKTLLPNQDSNGAGGLVEIETKSPLDRDRRYASFNGEYGRTGKDFGDEFLIGSTLSASFGAANDFGVSFSVSYRERETTNLNYDFGSRSILLGQYLPAGTDEMPVRSQFDLDPRRVFPFEEGVDDVYVRSSTVNFSSTKDDTLLIVGAVQKQVGVHTDLRFDVTHIRSTANRYNAATDFSTQARYDQGPVAELGGEERLVLVTEDPFRSDPRLGRFFGSGLLAGVGRTADLTPNAVSSGTVFSFRGKTVTGPWTLNYNFGYSVSKNDTGQNFLIQIGDQASGLSDGRRPAPVIDPALLTDAARQNVTADGRIISLFAPLVPGQRNTFILPLLNEQGFTFFNTIDNLPLTSFADQGLFPGRGDSYTIEGSVKRDFDHDHLKYIEIGVKYENETFAQNASERESLGFDPVGDVLLSEIGLAFGPGFLTDVGAEADFDRLTRESYEAVIANLDQLVSDGVLTTRPIGSLEQRLRSDQDTSENTLAAYFQTRVDLGKLEVVGGLRVDRVKVGSTFFTVPFVRDENDLFVPGFTEEFGQFITASRTLTNVLPRVQANYRFTENLIARFGFFTTVSRPSLVQITDRQTLQLFLNPQRSQAGDRPLLSVFQGNPDLKPAKTFNFDWSLEWYSQSIGVVKASVFYKRFKNSLQSNARLGGVEILPEDLDLPDIPFFNPLPDPIEVSVTEPRNDDDIATIWGLELAGERQLDMLPGFWSGFGVLANYTYTDGSRTREFFVPAFIDPNGFVEIDGVPLTGSPKHSGTAGLTYRKYKVDASLLYSIQGRRLSSFNPFSVHNYNEQIKTLDLRVEYLLEIAGVDTRIALRGTDLLRGKNKPFLQTSIGGDMGIPKYFTGGSFFGGRTLFIRVSANI
ncbi:MAG: TonB-dependent receptor [Sphingomonadales bacterium]|nr:TonB-dependent receptor [Sphingomonadales bacterium]